MTSSDDDADGNDDYKKTKKDVDKLKLEENEFREKRVCMPKPEVIYEKASSLACKLSDDNRFAFLHILEDLIKIQEINEQKGLSEKLKNMSEEIDENMEMQCEVRDINQPELEESLSEKVENISQKIEEDENMEIQCKIEQ